MLDLPEPKSNDGREAMPVPPYDDVRRAAVHSGHPISAGFGSRGAGDGARVRAEKTTVLPSGTP